jgi:hypothetical protein
MSRIHLFEFTDLSWYPQTFRRMQTDTLQFAATISAGHQNLIPLFTRAMQHTATAQIVDLGSGGKGCILGVRIGFEPVINPYDQEYIP